MAAILQAQIRKFEDAVRPYVSEGPLAPYWTLLEQKTKLKREQLALGICLGHCCSTVLMWSSYFLGLFGFLGIYLMFGWANDFLCNLIGFIYPAYAS